MAANGGRRIGILASRILRLSTSETLGAKGQQQRLGSYPIGSSQIRDSPSASVSGTAPAFQPQGRRVFKIELKGTDGAAVWRKFDGLAVRNASTTTHEPSAAAFKG